MYPGFKVTVLYVFSTVGGKNKPCFFLNSGLLSKLRLALNKKSLSVSLQSALGEEIESA